MEIPLIYRLDNCFQNAFINKRHALKGHNLRYVIGSVSFNDWFEYGGEDWTLEDFQKNKKGPHRWDAHAWLEDENGRVYDKIFKHYNWCAKKATGKETKIPDGTFINAVSKERCASLGVRYIPADKATQTAIFTSMLKTCLNDETRMLKLAR